MQLSEHFTLDEFTASDKAVELGIDNDPSPELYPALHRTAEGLEEVRALLGNLPIRISSGYRSPGPNGVNAAVGSKPSSQHPLGEAVDFTCARYGTPKTVVATIMASHIKFDQLIYEFGAWVHISFSDKNRRQVLTIDKQGPRPFA